MRYDSEHKDRTRGRVLKAAAQAMRKRGPHRLGVAQVMSGAGLTHGGFYAHFSSKDDLIAAAIDQMFEESRARFLRESDARPPGQALAAYIDFYLSTAHRDSVSAGCPIPILAGDVRRLSKAARARFAAGMGRLVQILADQIRKLGLAEAELTAASVMGELVGALSLARCEPDPDRSAAILRGSRLSLKRRLGLQEPQ